MKKILYLIAGVCLVLCLGALDRVFSPGMPAPLSTIQPRSVVVNTVTADDTVLDVNEKTWADCVSLFTPIPPEWNIVILSFYGYGDGTGAGDPNDATFSFDVQVCDLYGGIESVSVSNTGGQKCPPKFLGFV